MAGFSVPLRCYFRPFSRGRRAAEAGDYPRALGLFEEATAGGDTNALVDLAVMYEDGKGVPLDKVKALNLLQTAARRGNPWAAMILSDKYENGNGMPKDLPQAYRWILLASSANYIPEVVSVACEQRCSLESKLGEREMAAGRWLAGIGRHPGREGCRCVKREDCGVDG